MKAFTLFLIVIISLVSTNLQANQAIEQLQGSYRNNGATSFEALDGKALWYSEQNGRSCTSCHGTSPTAVGKHWKTGKKIMPMALSVNPQRLTKAAKIEKWFLRNCKWTLGRECSPQEKGNILKWLQQL
jgi:Domain of unknown function (DUF1924)